MEDHVWNRNSPASIRRARFCSITTRTPTVWRKYFRGGLGNRSQAIELERRAGRADQGR